MIFWLILMIGMVVLELSTAQMVSIWFAIGALGALIATYLGAEIWLQIIIFLVVSGIALVATRPFVKKLTAGKKVPTNADRYVGRKGVVTATVDNQQGVGLVKIEGSVWSARSVSGEVLPAGEQVVVERIEGVKLMVQRAEVSCTAQQG